MGIAGDERKNAYPEVQLDVQDTLVHKPTSPERAQSSITRIGPRKLTWVRASGGKKQEKKHVPLQLLGKRKTLLGDSRISIRKELGSTRGE